MMTVEQAREAVANTAASGDRAAWHEAENQLREACDRLGYLD